MSAPYLVINPSLFLTLKIFLLLKWQFFLFFLCKTTRNLSISQSINQFICTLPCTFVINPSLFLTLKIYLLLKWDHFLAFFLWKTIRNLSIYLFRCGTWSCTKTPWRRRRTTCARGWRSTGPPHTPPPASSRQSPSTTQGPSDPGQGRHNFWSLTFFLRL